jgi:hypothetical protein
MVVMRLKIGLDPLLDLLVRILRLRCVGLSNSNGELTECGESPHDHYVTALPMLVVVLQNVLVDVNDFRIVHDNGVAVRVLTRAIGEHFSELTHEPHSQLDKANLVKIFFHSVVHLRHRVLMQLRGCCNNCDNLRNVLFSDMSLRQGKNLNHGVNVPFFIGRILFADLANFVGKLLFEFAISAQQVICKLLHNRFDVGVVSDFIDEVQGLLLDLHVVVLQAVRNGALVALHRIVVDVNHLLQLLQSDISHVVFAVHQEATQDVDSKHSQTLGSLDSHDGPRTL